MLIAQLTDLHLGFEPDNPSEFNRQRLDAALAWLARQSVQPDMLFLTGDLTDRGDVASYERLREAIAACGFPVHLCTGNHDDRAALRQVFPEVPEADGFIQYVVDTDAVRFIILDTLDDGHHGGAFCATRATWLRARLAEVPGQPVMIVLHHPPIDTGIGWMTAGEDEPWVQALHAAIGERANVTMICGHIHRAIATSWHGRMLMVSPSTAPQVALDLAAIDPDRPDERAMIVAEAPGVALHLWTGAAFVTHVATAVEYPVLARYTDSLQPLVQSLHDEHLGATSPASAAAA